MVASGWVRRIPCQRQQLLLSVRVPLHLRLGERFSRTKGRLAVVLNEAFSGLESDSWHLDTWVRCGESGALPDAVRRCYSHCRRGGSKQVISSSRWRTSRLIRVWIAAGLSILGAVLVWAALARPSTPDSAAGGAPTADSLSSASPDAPKPSPEPSTAPAGRSDVRDKITGLVLPESDPVALSIPKIGVQSRLVKLGLRANGEMQTPAPPVAGWFTRGATPGALGPAVIAGHVTWNGPAVFYRLGSMRRGDEVTVTREDGKVAIFTVSRVAHYSKSRFPSRAVYGPIDHAGLRLITCAGTYDSAKPRHKYSDNVVVFARLVGVREPGS